METHKSGQHCSCDHWSRFSRPVPSYINERLELNSNVMMRLKTLFTKVGDKPQEPQGFNHFSIIITTFVNDATDNHIPEHY